ncbi:MAG: Gfo/Idh/MocA family protein [Acidimicrobiia bacterium]
MSITSGPRVGIIGVGNIGTAYAMAIASSPLVRLTAVCDPDKKQRDGVAATTDTEAFSSHHDLANSQLCDAVIVCTPPSTHPQVVQDCLQAGLDVLCEKPFAIDATDASQMFRTAAQTDNLLAMASKFRYVPDVAKAAALIRSGAIGEPTLIDVTFASIVDMSNRWNSVRSVSGGGVLIDNGTHAADVVRFLVGPISRVSAVQGKTASTDNVEDTAILLAETACDAIATINVSWAMPAHKQSFVVVNGTEGALKIGWTESVQRLSDTGEWTHFGPGYSKMDALRSNVENFVSASMGVEEMRISTDDVMASVSVIDAAYEAIRTGQWVTVHQPSASAMFEELGVASQAG